LEPRSLVLDRQRDEACRILIGLNTEADEVSSGTETVTDNDWSTHKQPQAPTKLTNTRLQRFKRKPTLLVDTEHSQHKKQRPNKINTNPTAVEHQTRHTLVSRATPAMGHMHQNQDATQPTDGFSCPPSAELERHLQAFHNQYATQPTNNSNLPSGAGLALGAFIYQNATQPTDRCCLPCLGVQTPSEQQRLDANMKASADYADAIRRKLDAQNQLFQRLKRGRQIAKILDYREGYYLAEYKDTVITKDEYDLLNWSPF
jgi:hypothetical protein